MANRIMALKDVHILIPKTCAYVTISGKRDFVDVIRSRILNRDIILDYRGGHDVIIRDLTRVRQEVRVRKGNMMMEVEFKERETETERFEDASLWALKMEGGGHEARNAGRF